MNLWQVCEGENHIQSLSVEPWRIVEAQHELSSRDLVDSSEEHDILEELLEESKPEIEKQKDYLIFTPFRYPPLKYGSRFGGVHEPSLWYGSMTIETAFAEVAYYRLLFLKHSSADLGYLEIPMTAFSTKISTDKGVDLCKHPFLKQRNKISAKDNYQYSQALGSNMREAGVEAFIFYSARCRKEGQNIAAFTPDVFVRKNNQYIHHRQTWFCMASKQIVEFTRMGIAGKKRLSFEETNLFCNANLITSAALPISF